MKIQNRNDTEIMIKYKDTIMFKNIQCIRLKTDNELNESYKTGIYSLSGKLNF